MTRAASRLGAAVLVASLGFGLQGVGAGASRAPAPRSVTPHAKTISWSGFDWTVRQGHGGPGPNRWKRSNVWVDGDGFLHLRIAFDGRRWSCAELETTQRLGFGTYSWVVDGPIDRLDRNVVLGLFDYPTPDVGPDGTNEIDIEFARWGNGAYPPGNYTVWPAVQGFSSKGRSFDFTLPGSLSTSTFVRASTSIAFRTLDRDGQTLGDWTFAPGDPLKRISQAAMPVHINLWLFRGHPPSDGQQVEIVIRSFSFTPAAR